MKIWAKTKEFCEGKFLVVRRDGTVPHWPHFVLGARDPAAAFALRQYAIKATMSVSHDNIRPATDEEAALMQKVEWNSDTADDRAKLRALLKTHPHGDAA